MSFRTNLQYLRAQRNMTQEQLAMLLGVSRQAISKWESEKAYPEMDKLLAICDLFGCTLDDLVLGDVRHPAVAPGVAGAMVPGSGSFTGSGAGPEQSMDGAAWRGTPAAAGANGGAGHDGSEQAGGGHTGVSGDGSDGSSHGIPGADRSGTGTADGQPTAMFVSANGGASVRPNRAAASRPIMSGTAMPDAAVLPKDITGYDEHMRTQASKRANGVAMILAGVAVGQLFDDKHSILGINPMNDFLMFLCIVVGVIAGLMFLVPSGLAHAAFMRNHPYVEDFYTDEDRSRASKRLGVAVVAGVALILAGVATAMYADEVLGIGDGWPNGIMFGLITMGVYLFVYFGMHYSMLNLDEYNKEAEEERAEREGKQDYYSKLTGTVCGIIMIIATIIGLWMLFAGSVGALIGGDWSDIGATAGASLFWLAWPIGGLCCGVATLIIQIFKDRHNR